MSVGYSTRCKVCNSPYRADIEQWIEEGTSTRAVSRRLAEQGERISHEAIRRHMQEHFDVKAAAREQYEKSQQVMVQQVDKVISEVEMLDQVARSNFEMHQMAQAWLMEEVQSRDEEGKRTGRIRQALVQLSKGTAEEVRQTLKTKMELLGTSEETEKATDFADLLIEAWGKANDGNEV